MNCINSEMFQTFRHKRERSTIGKCIYTTHQRAKHIRQTREESVPGHTSRTGLNGLLAVPPSGRAVRIPCSQCSQNPSLIQFEFIAYARAHAMRASTFWYWDKHTHTQYKHAQPEVMRTHTCVPNAHSSIVNIHNITQSIQTAPQSRTIMRAQIEINAQCDCARTETDAHLCWCACVRWFFFQAVGVCVRVLSELANSVV